MSIRCSILSPTILEKIWSVVLQIFVYLEVFETKTTPDRLKCFVASPEPCPKQALGFTCLQYKSFENTVGKGEIARNEQFLLFPHCFLPVWWTFCHFHQIWNCRLQTLLAWKSLKFVVWERLNMNDIFLWKNDDCQPSTFLRSIVRSRSSSLFL